MPSWLAQNPIFWMSSGWRSSTARGGTASAAAPPGGDSDLVGSNEYVVSLPSPQGEHRGGHTTRGEALHAVVVLADALAEARAGRPSDKGCPAD